VTSGRESELREARTINSLALCPAFLPPLALMRDLHTNERFT
jgi:hypothetical protein